MRKLMCLGLAVASSLMMGLVSAYPASAETAQPQLTQQPVYTFTIESTPTDANFNPTGPTTVVVSESTSHPCTNEKSDTCKSVMMQGTSTATTGTLSASYYTGGYPTWSGCRKVHAFVHEWDLLGGSAYIWNEWLEWCWGFATVFNPHVTQGMTDNDGTHQYQGKASQGWPQYYYRYFTGIRHSGFYAQRNATITNCVYIFCGKTTYPWTWIRAHGDGTYSYDWGWY